MKINLWSECVVSASNFSNQSDFAVTSPAHEKMGNALAMQPSQIIIEEDDPLLRVRTYVWLAGWLWRSYIIS